MADSSIQVVLPGGSRVDAAFKGFTIKTDQPAYAGGDNTARIWDAATGQPRPGTVPLHHDGPVRDVVLLNAGASAMNTCLVRSSTMAIGAPPWNDPIARSAPTPSQVMKKTKPTIQNAVWRRFFACCSKRFRRQPPRSTFGTARSASSLATRLS